jgi:hypothetical protein
MVGVDLGEMVGAGRFGWFVGLRSEWFTRLRGSDQTDASRSGWFETSEIRMV